MAGRSKADIPAAQSAQNAKPELTMAEVWPKLKDSWKAFLLNMYAFESQIAAARFFKIESAVRRAYTVNKDQFNLRKAMKLRNTSIKSQVEVVNLMLADASARLISEPSDVKNFKLVSEAARGIKEAYRALKTDDAGNPEDPGIDWSNLSIMPPVSEVEDG